MADNNGMAVQNALQGAGIQFAMPQSVLSVPKTSHQVQRVMYDPQKLQALKDALGVARPTMSKWEAVANALAQTPEARSFTGGFGEEIINPWAVGLSSLARGFGGAYSARKASEREAEEKAREDAIKAAQMDLEASKQQVTDSVAQDYIKFNDPNAKGMQELEKQAKDLQTVQVLMNQLEDIGTRFDDEFANIDDIQNNATKFGTATRGALWGAGRSTREKQGQEDFDAWKGSVKNILVNANKQAGSGAMSDADAARYEQEIGKAKDPAQARNIMRSFWTRLTAPMTANAPQTPEAQAANDFMRGNI